MLTIRPACQLPGDYCYTTNGESLRRLLLRTDLPSTVLDRFETGIWNCEGLQFARRGNKRKDPPGDRLLRRLGLRCVPQVRSGP